MEETIEAIKDSACTMALTGADVSPLCTRYADLQELAETVLAI